MNVVKYIFKLSITENEVLQHLLIDEVRPFLHSELKFRKLFHYPPFFRLIRLELRAEKKMPMEQKAIQLAYALTQIKGIGNLGPRVSNFI